MAQLKRTGPTTTIAGLGLVRRDVTHTVPDELVDDLLSTGEWVHTTAAGSEAQYVVEAPAPERLTEVPAPTPAAKPPVRRRSTTKPSKK